MINNNDNRIVGGLYYVVSLEKNIVCDVFEVYDDMSDYPDMYKDKRIGDFGYLCLSYVIDYKNNIISDNISNDDNLCFNDLDSLVRGYFNYSDDIDFDIIRNEFLDSYMVLSKDIVSNLYSIVSKAVLVYCFNDCLYLRQ